MEKMLALPPHKEKYYGGCDPYKEPFEIHIMSETGMYLRDPSYLATPNWALVTFKESTWAERKRDELRWKIKTRKAKLMLIVKILLMIGWVVVVGSIIVGIFFLTYIWKIRINQITGMWLGILGAELIAIGFMFISGTIESNPSYIRIKR